jgi:nitrate reductase NapE component
MINLRGKRKQLILLIFTIFLVYYYAFSKVTVSQGTVTWKHVSIGINNDHTYAGSNAGNAGMLPSIYNAIILENEYIRIKLVPSAGARINSIYYKPTNHEELWAHSNATPMAMNSFYYNWLLVWGGIFPTLSAPEHGKYWFLPWEYQITKQKDDTVTVTMYMTDSIPWRSSYSSNFTSYGATGLRCTFAVSLVSGKTGVDVDVTLENPNSSSINFEYWTCTTLSPGCDTENLKLNDGAEIIMPDDTIKIHPSYNGLKAQEKQVTGDWYIFNKLRWWKNWVEAGILYAQPKQNFWGAINHNDPNKEGIMRIADNSVTYSCKIWTCGYTGLPYWEPWAGISDEFFKKTTLGAQTVKKWHEFYTPIVGLDSVTDASENILINLKTNKINYDGNIDDSVYILCQIFKIVPLNSFSAVLSLDGNGFSQTIYENTIIPNPQNGNYIKISLPVKSIYNATNKLSAIFRESGKVILSAERRLSFINASTTRTIIPFLEKNISKNEISYQNVNIYNLNGRQIKGNLKTKLINKNILKKGVYLMVDSRGVNKKVLMDFKK